MIPTFSKLNMNVNFKYLLEIIWFSSIPIFVSEGFSSGHPDKFALLALVRAAAPEVLVPHPEARDVLLQLPLLLLAVDAGQVHVVEPAVLLRLVPVRLEKYSEVVFLSPKFLKRHCVRFSRVDCESRSLVDSLSRGPLVALLIAREREEDRDRV